jgi:hypothetical protein
MDCKGPAIAKCLEGNKRASKLKRVCRGSTLLVLKGGYKMASQPVADQPEKPGSPYCSDPNCEYCKNLREAEERLSKVHEAETRLARQ